MSPLQAFALLGLAFGFLYLNSRRVIGLGANGYDNPTAPGGFTQDQLNYYLGGFTKHISGAQAAELGASTGAAFAGATFGISIGVGALAGYLWARNTNNTKDDREVFAQRLGFSGDGLGVHTDVTTDLGDKSKGLYSYLIFIGRSDLTDYAMHVIGRQDFDHNTQWMVDVLAALWTAGFPFPK